MSKWRTWAVDLGDRLPPLSDLTFANDILVFARCSHEIMRLLGTLGQFPGDAGLKLNAEKPCLSQRKLCNRKNNMVFRREHELKSIF